jgi:hypothetical protein
MDALAGLWFALAVIVGAVLLVLVMEEVLYLGTLVRTILAWGLIVGGAVLVCWRVGVPFLRLLGVVRDEDDLTSAARIGKAFPAVADRLVNILQLQNERGDRLRFSVELMNAARSDLEEQLSGLDFVRAVDDARPRRWRRIAGSVAVLGALTVLVSPSGFLGSAYRLVHFGEVFGAPAAFRIVVDPGSREVVKGSDVMIVARIEGAGPSSVTLVTSHPGEQVSEEYLLQPGPDGLLRHEFKALKLTTAYSLRAGDVRTQEFLLTVVDRPLITRLSLTVTPPAYTRLPAQELEDNVGDAAVLAGTRVQFRIEASKNIVDGAIVLHDSTAILLQAHGATASGSLVVRRECVYHLRIVDRQGVENADPVQNTLRVIPDAPPTVAIIVPGTNIDLTDNTSLGLLVKIGDDYGFTSMRLSYRLVQSSYEQPAQRSTAITIPLNGASGTEALVPYTWDLKPLHLVPEDVVAYSVEVTDNDRVTGPKTTVSETYTLRLPSFEEVARDVDERHEASLQGMQQALSEAKEAQKDLEELQQDLRREQQKLDWQNQKKSEELLKRYEDIRKSVEQANATVDRMMEEMQKNRMLSPETLEKYQELQRLMEELNSPELAEALKKLQESMQQPNPEALRQALQQFSVSEENFRKSLDRTIQLIKRLHIEQKMDALVRRAEEMQKTQEELGNRTAATEPADSSSIRDLQRRQEGAREDVQQMRKDLRDVRSAMEEYPREMPLEEMQALEDSLQQAAMEQQMEAIQKELEQGKMQSASAQQQQVSRNLSSLTRQLRGMKDAMQRNQQQAMARELRKALDNLLELSRREEALKNQAQGMEQNAQGLRENAQEQMEVLRDLNGVTQAMTGMSQKSFSITPDMGKAIGDAMREMASAMQSLEQRNPGAAAQQQSAAMGSLNEAAQMVGGALSAMMQPGNQGMTGMSGFLQRLQQLTDAQRGVNDGTQGLGGMTPEQVAEMGRLAAEQGMVRKSLEQLQREAASSGQLQKLLGDLRSVAEEMREVQTDLAGGNVTPETMRKQERILSRLLDSQRSTRERDFEERRKAEAGKNQQRRSSTTLDLTTREGVHRLRRDLLKALQEGYTRDYEDLIRKYFEALEEPPAGIAPSPPNQHH